MRHATFFKHLFWISAVAIALSLAQSQLPVLATYVSLALISVTVFVCLSIVMYVFTYRIVKQARHNQFIGLFMIFTLFKMILAISVVGLYARFAEPPNRFFVLPFFLIYLIYTAFEIWFMDKLGRMQPK
ncbi:MAG: hypothetical protein AAGI23_10205 [Bacteroidota bacterium]